MSLDAARQASRELQSALLLAVAAVERLQAALDDVGHPPSAPAPEAPSAAPSGPETERPPSRGAQLLDPRLIQWETFGDSSDDDEDQGPDSTSE